MKAKAILAMAMAVVLAAGAAQAGSQIDSIIPLGFYSSIPIPGNAAATYDPVNGRFYSAVRSHTVGGTTNIYTTDLSGNLLATWKFEGCPDPYNSSSVTGLAFDQERNRLVALAAVTTREEQPGLPSVWEYHLVELGTDGTPYADRVLPTEYVRGGGNVFVNGAGTWLSSYATSTITHLSADGVLLAQFHAGGFPGQGLFDLTESFNGGFFLMDFYGPQLDGTHPRIVEVASDGTYIGEMSTRFPEGDARGLSIDSDLQRGLVFVNANNEIFVLSGVPGPHPEPDPGPGPGPTPAIPEPASVVCGLIGLGMIGGYIKKRRAA